MTTPTTIFIDTCIFDESAYNLQSASFKTFREAIKPFKIKLLIPDPTDREIKRHIKDRSKQAVKSLKDAVHRAPFLAQLKNWPLNQIFFLEEELQKQVHAELSRFYGDFEVVKLGYEGIKIDDIMNWYERNEPPFSERKKREFPDAFSVAAINDYHKSSSEHIAIISSDNDFKRVCESCNHLFYYPSLRSYSEAIRQKDKIIDNIHRLLSDDDEIVQKSICDEFINLMFIVEESWEGESEDVEITDFIKIEYHVVGIGDHSYSIAFDAEIRFKASVSYPDIATAVWEKGEAYPLYTIEGTVYSDAEISGVLKITTDENEKKIANCNGIEFDQEYITIYGTPNECDEYD